MIPLGKIRKMVIGDFSVLVLKAAHDNNISKCNKNLKSERQRSKNFRVHPEIPKTQKLYLGACSI